MSEIKTIIFDVGEVLITGFYGMENVINEELGSMASPLTNAQLQTEELKAFFLGKISENTLWERMIERFGWKNKLSVPRLKRLIRRHMTPVDGTLDIARELKKKGYRLALLSVHGKEWVTHIASKYNHHSLFECIAYSYHTGCAKPDEWAWADLLERLDDPDPATCLYIDDWDKNIETAKRLGFMTHHFRNAKMLRSELGEIGILDKLHLTTFIRRERKWADMSLGNLMQRLKSRSEALLLRSTLIEEIGVIAFTDPSKRPRAINALVELLESEIEEDTKTAVAYLMHLRDVNVLPFKAQRALERFESDPDNKKILPSRLEVIGMNRLPSPIKRPVAKTIIPVTVNGLGSRPMHRQAIIHQ